MLARLPAARTIMFDNLKWSHFSDTIQNAFDQSIHRAAPRPPYRPNDAPIEFVLNQIEIGLRSRMYEITNGAQLQQAIHQIIGNLNGIHATFLHCGY